MAKEKHLNEPNVSELQPIPGFSSVNKFTTDGFKLLKDAIKHSNSLPQGNDWNFYNTFEAFPTIATHEGNNILGLMTNVMKHYEIGINSLQNKTLDEKTELMVEANDVILEKVANNIDELNGIRKSVAEPIEIQTVSAEIPINESWNKLKPTFSVNSKQLQTNCIRLITAKNIIRPQNFFKDKLDNSKIFPWQPRIKDKPNSLKPLAVFLEEYEDRQEFSHPYDCELERFSPLPQHLDLKTEPELPKSLADTPLIEVTSSEQLEELLETLRTCTEFAVDLEHHSYRSFMGFTCLMQISTKDKDYLIDTLVLRDKLWILNEVFTKPSIVKIFHGALLDVEWLQRDLSLYVVNMFDTHEAAKLLNYPNLSLAYLLQKFCKVTPNKQFQLADWRIRPLPDELKLYAREDTHYLIYIYESLKKELKSKPNMLVKVVFERSTEICKRRYFKPIFTQDSFMELYRRSKRNFDNRQLYCLKNLYEWRDTIARQEDESFGYVLPNHMLLHISELLPREMQGILACCNPIPPLVRSNLLEIHKVVLKAREQPLEKPILREVVRDSGQIRSKINFNSPLYCPHDLSKMHEFRDDLPTLLKRQNCEELLEIEQTQSMYSVFNSNDVIEETQLNLNYLSPFGRYKLVKSFIQHEDEQQKQMQIKLEEEKSKITEIDNRTDEERIASIREHFLTLSKKFNEEEQKKAQEELMKNQSLVEMGGRKKIKRDIPDIDYYEDSIVPARTYIPQGKKRKIQSDPDENTPMKSKKQRRIENRRRKMKNKQAQMPQVKQEVAQSMDKGKQKQKGQNQQQQPRQQRQPNRKQKQQQKQQKQQQQQRQKQQQKQQEQQQSQSSRKARWRTKKQKQQENVSNQNCFVPYDYTSVDFRQFQGGGEEVNGGQQIRSNFKAKGGKRMRNKGSKSSTFVGSKGRSR